MKRREGNSLSRSVARFGVRHEGLAALGAVLSGTAGGVVVGGTLVGGGAALGAGSGLSVAGASGFGAPQSQGKNAVPAALQL